MYQKEGRDGVFPGEAKVGQRMACSENQVLGVMAREGLGDVKMIGNKDGKGD